MMFWERVVLKDRAKDVLRKSYWMAFAITLIMLLLNFVANGISSGNDWSVDFNFVYRDFYYVEHWINSYVLQMLALGGLIGLGIAIAVAAFVRNIFEIGKNRFFTLCRYDSIRFSEIIYGFKGGYYMNNVKTLFMRDLYTWLWSLLFVIPGIVKRYSYWMMAYILAENPTISTERAFEISKKTTEGEKWDMFVLDLSFLGWYLLSVLTCGFGIFFLMPYIEATKAELYGALRYKAVTTGICTRDEIGAEIELA